MDNAKEILKSLETPAIPEFVQRYKQKSKNTEDAKVVLETLRTDLIPMYIQFSQYDQYERLRELRQKALEIEKERQIQRKRAWVSLTSGIAAISLGMIALVSPVYAEEIKIDPILQVKPEVVNKINQDQGSESKVKTVIDDSHDDSQQASSKSEPKTEIVVNEKEQVKDSKPEPKSEFIAAKQDTTKQTPEPKSESVVKSEPVITTKQGSSKPEPKIAQASSSTKAAIDHTKDHTKVATFTKTADQSSKAVSEKQAVIAQLEKLSTDNQAGTQAVKDTYVVRKGDTLWELSEKVYGNGGKWTKIWEANKVLLIQQDERNVNDPGHWIYPGQTLQIPTK